jgi:uncharacterized protein YbjT (DUF2867 family)
MRSTGAHEIETNVLVVNGTGKTGRRVVDRLWARGVPTRVGSRSGNPPFDWADPSTWERALEGMNAAYVAYPDLAPGGPDAVGAFSELAVGNGTRRLVLLGGRGEEEAERTEEALKQSGADWTVIRSSFFMQGFSESVFLDPLLAGELALPVDRVAEPFVDADDIADVAIAALGDQRHAGRVYDLTGPRLLRFDEAVAEIARASGRPMRYVPLTMEEFATAMAREGVPEEDVALLGHLFTEVLDGRNSYLGHGVEEALGRPPRDFSEYARNAAAAGTWSASQIAA